MQPIKLQFLFIYADGILQKFEMFDDGHVANQWKQTSKWSPLLLLLLLSSSTE